MKKSMFCLSLFVLVLLLSSCKDKEESSSLADLRCGDGVCDAVERDRGICADDCDRDLNAPSPSRSSLEDISDISYKHDTYSYEPVLKETSWMTAVSFSERESEETDVDGVSVTRTDYFVKNPTSGAQLDVSIYAPTDASSSNKYPGLIMVPAGVGSKEDFTKNPYDHRVTYTTPEKFAASGFVVLIFSADGRGSSAGTEDYNGYVQQDGLYELFRFLQEQEIVESSNIGFSSFSYGVAMVSGMLGRYQPDAKYFIEWEGPVNRYWVSFSCSGRGAVQEEITCDDESYWQEREAMRFVPYFPVDYFVIVQREDNHAQPTFDHSVEMNNWAIQYLDWVRVNGPDNAINKEYTIATFPVLEGTSYKTEILDYITEIADE